MQSHFLCFGDHLKLSIVLFVLVRFCSTLFLIPRPTIRIARAYTPLLGLFQAVALKKTIRELEEKVQDQEEELDDQAGKIQMLEQV